MALTTTHGTTGTGRRTTNCSPPTSIRVQTAGGQYQLEANISWRPISAVTSGSMTSPRTIEALDGGTCYRNKFTLKDLEEQEHVGVLHAEHGQKCLVCWTRICAIALKPCGHLCMCRGCALQSFSQASPMCPLCQTPFFPCSKNLLKYLTAKEGTLWLARLERLRREEVLRNIVARWLQRSAAVCVTKWSEFVSERKRLQETSNVISPAVRDWYQRIQMNSFFEWRDRVRLHESHSSKVRGLREGLRHVLGKEKERTERLQQELGALGDPVSDQGASRTQLVLRRIKEAEQSLSMYKSHWNKTRAAQLYGITECRAQGNIQHS